MGVGNVLGHARVMPLADDVGRAFYGVFTEAQATFDMAVMMSVEHNGAANDRDLAYIATNTRPKSIVGATEVIHAKEGG